MSQTHFILVRHGETLWNLEGRRQGQADSPLTPLGVAQARAIAHRLAGEGADALYSSDLPRALLTAEQISAACGLPVVADAQLREKSFGVLEGLRPDEVLVRYPEVAAHLERKSPDYAPPGGESLAAAQRRGIAALTGLARRHPGGRLIVVSHGALLGIFLRHVLGISLSAPRRFALQNGSLSFVSHRAAEDAWFISAMGETSHLRSLNGIAADVAAGREPGKEDNAHSRRCVRT
jgi:probable phosphoglycerate mutase